MRSRRLRRFPLSLADRLATLAAHSARSPSARALVAYDAAGERTVSSPAELVDAALRLAAELRRLGIEPGDRVATISRNRPEVLLAYLACWSSGAVACPVNVEETPERKRYILRHGGAAVALVEAPFLDEVVTLQTHLPSLRRVLAIEGLSDRLARLAPLAPVAMAESAGAFLVYTSGTTGDPKGVLLSQGNLLSNASATAAWHDLGPGQAVMTVLPIHHVNGAVVTGLAPLLAGATVVLNPGFSPRTFWRRLADERAAIASVVPTLLEFLLGADDDVARLDLGALRYLLCGAGPLLNTTVTRFEDRFGVPICHGFGMSETTAYNTQMPMGLPAGDRRRLYTAYGFPSVGCALACNEVAVVRSDGGEAAPLERGQIAVRGPTVMAGYLADPEATADAFLGDWFLSGDEGFYDDVDGRRFFFVSGRLKELIVRGGVNLSPLEIDEALRRLPGVAFALALPFENRAYGEEVAAFVVREPGAELSEAQVLAHAGRTLPFAMRPKVVVFGQEVPFTTTGKPRRLALARSLAPELARYREVQFRDPER